MKRCAICDYTEETGRDFTGAKVERRKITYNTRFKEYYCTACTQDIKDSRLHYWYYDVSKGKENPTDSHSLKERLYGSGIFNLRKNKPSENKHQTINENVQDTVFEIPTALPPLLVE